MQIQEVSQLSVLGVSKSTPLLYIFCRDAHRKTHLPQGYFKVSSFSKSERAHIVMQSTPEAPSVHPFVYSSISHDFAGLPFFQDTPVASLAHLLDTHSQNPLTVIPISPNAFCAINIPLLRIVATKKTYKSYLDSLAHSIQTGYQWSHCPTSGAVWFPFGMECTWKL